MPIETPTDSTLVQLYGTCCESCCCHVPRAPPTWGRQRAVCGAERHSPPGAWSTQACSAHSLPCLRLATASTSALRNSCMGGKLRWTGFCTGWRSVWARSLPSSPNRLLACRSERKFWRHAGSARQPSQNPCAKIHVSGRRWWQAWHGAQLGPRAPWPWEACGCSTAAAGAGAAAAAGIVSMPGWVSLRAGGCGAAAVFPAGARSQEDPATRLGAVCS